MRYSISTDRKIDDANINNPLAILPGYDNVLYVGKRTTSKSKVYKPVR
jgi:hypothetical protein